MSYFYKDNWGNNLRDEEGHLRPTKTFWVHFIIGLFFVFGCWVFWMSYVDRSPTCLGCGKIIIEGVGLSFSGELVDGGASYHNGYCIIEEERKIMNKEVQEGLRILKKMDRLNKNPNNLKRLKRTWKKERDERLNKNPTDLKRLKRTYEERIKAEDIK